MEDNIQLKKVAITSSPILTRAYVANFTEDNVRWTKKTVTVDFSGTKKCIKLDKLGQLDGVSINHGVLCVSAFCRPEDVEATKAVVLVAAGRVVSSQLEQLLSIQRAVSHVNGFVDVGGGH